MLQQVYNLVFVIGKSIGIKEFCEQGFLVKQI